MGWRQQYHSWGSFRGIQFKIEDYGRQGGRRIALHEFPKRDVPYAEDMGRKAKRFSVRGYVIGNDYLVTMNQLIDACDKSGPGTLVHPTLGQISVVCESCDATEHRDRGGYADINMQFVEYGAAPNQMTSAATQAIVNAGARAAEDAAGSVANTLRDV